MLLRQKGCTPSLPHPIHQRRFGSAGRWGIPVPPHRSPRNVPTPLKDKRLRAEDDRLEGTQAPDGRLAMCTRKQLHTGH